MFEMTQKTDARATPRARRGRGTLPPADPELDELRRTVATLRRIVDNTWDMILEIDPYGRYRYANKATRRITGYEPRQLQSKNLLDFLRPTDRDAVASRLAKRRAGRPAQQPYEAALTRADGSQAILEITAQTVREQGRIAAVEVIARDITRRKAAEEALRREEKRLRNVLEASRDLIYVVDVTSRQVEYYSPACKRVTGFDAEQLRRKGFMGYIERMHPEDFKRIDALMSRAHEPPVRKQIPPIGEFRWKHRDGRYRWFQDAHVLTHTDDGRLQLIGAIRDITDDREVRDRILRSEQRLKGILDSLAGAIIHEVDACGVIVDSHINPELLQSWGLKIGDVIGHSVSEFVSPATNRRILREIRRLLREGGAYREETQVHLPAGEFWFTTNMRPFEHPSGKARSVLTFHVDITERRRTEQALRDSEQQMRTILSSLTDAMVLLVDNRGQFLSFWGGPDLSQRYGLDLTQLVGKRLADVLPPDEAEFWLREVQRVIRSRKPYRGAHRFTLPNGVFWLDVADYPARNSQGKVYAASVFILDITERVQAAQSAEQAHRAVQQARTDERRRLASELHDSVGQQMVGMHLLLQQLQAQIAACATPRVRGILNQMSTGCTQLIREVRQISHGLYPPTLESMGLQASLEQLAMQHENAVQITVQGCDACQAVRFPPLVENEFFRIAQEALCNALRHGRASRIHMRLGLGKGTVQMEITDNGVGFDVRKAATGLGLRIMNDRAANLNGKLEIVSRKGRTRIRVIAPAEPVDPDTHVACPIFPTPKGRRK